MRRRLHSSIVPALAASALLACNSSQSGSEPLGPPPTLTDVCPQGLVADDRYPVLDDGPYAATYRLRVLGQVDFLRRLRREGLQLRPRRGVHLARAPRLPHRAGRRGLEGPALQRHRLQGGTRRSSTSPSSRTGVSARSRCCLRDPGLHHGPLRGRRRSPRRQRPRGLTHGAVIDADHRQSAEGPVWRRARDDRYYLFLLDEDARTVQVAVLHPGNLPAAVRALLPALPNEIPGAAIDALLDLRRPQ